MSEASLPDEQTQAASSSHTRHRSDILFAFAVAIAIYLAWKLRRELVLIYVSALFAVVLTPVLRFIMKFHIGRWKPGKGAAIFILFVTILASAIAFISLAIPPVIHDLHDFALEMPTRGPQLLDRVHHLPFLQHVNLNALNARLQDFASRFATYVLFSISDWAKTLFDIITGIFLTVYFMLEGETAYSWLLSLFPVEMRQRLDSTMARAKVRMGKWLLGQGSLMLILGICSTIVFAALRIRYAYALGVLMGLFNLIPVVGAMISVSLVVLVAAIDSWGRVIGVLVFYAIYAQVENSYLTPRIMQTSVDLAGLAVIIALLLGSALAGVAGALVSVPTAVLIAVLLNEYAVKPETNIIAADSGEAP
ncbi:MAG TPA: AI-2E family transporter [Acidobacteriaceae bacterium]|nr:AI-2E family transporter [Acidobacteriaceae bacterium]